MSLVAPDISEFQDPITSAYKRDFLIFRGTFGAGKLDNHFLANASQCAKLHAKGQLAGAVIYTVFLPGDVAAQAAFLWRAIGPTPPPWLAGIMIDVESWRGTSYSISGDHSSAINRLYGLHAHKMGSWSSVIAYGNTSDLAAIYPGRDKRCRVIVAGYGSRLTYTKVKGAIGQQYTDGQPKWGVPKGLPLASPPLGRCDHNVFPAYRNGAALRASLRPVVKTVTKTTTKTTTTVTAKPAPKPAPPKHAPSPQPPYAAGRSAVLVSPNRHSALFLTDSGRLELHTDHRLTWHS